MGQVSHGGCRYPTPHLPTTQPPWLIVFVANSSWMLAKSSCWFWFQCCWWLCQVFLSGFFFFLFFVFCFSPRSCVFLCFFSFLFLFFLHLPQAGFWFMVAGCCPDCSHLGGHPGFVSSAQVSPAPVNEISLASLFAAWLHDCPGDWRARVWLISSLMELFHLWGCRNMPGNWAPLLQLE